MKSHGGIEFAAGARHDYMPACRAWQAREAKLRERLTISGSLVKFLTRTERPAKSASDDQVMPEMIFPGAFAESLASAENVRAVLQHEDAWELGQTDDYSLRLWEDDEGLRYRLAFDHENRLGALLYNSVDRGHLDGLSFKFTPARNGVIYSSGTRVICKARLLEISFILSPWRAAYRSGTAHLDVPLSVYRRRLDAALGAAR